MVLTLTSNIFGEPILSSRFSMRVASMPRRPKSAARAKPTGPPPTIRTGVSILLSLIFVLMLALSSNRLTLVGSQTKHAKGGSMQHHLAKLALATLLLGANATLACAQVSDNVVKIGVLTDLSGPASTPTGPGSVAAAQMAIDDFGGSVLGKPIQLISADHQLKPDIGAGIARRWYDTEQVYLILDVPVSSVGLAVQVAANEKHKLFITHSTGSTDFHGKFCSPYTMQWVFDTRALAVGTGREITKRGGKTWVFITHN